MCLLLFCSLLSFQENKSVFVDRVAIKVNDKIITERELLYSYKKQRELALAQAQGAELDRRLQDAWKDTVKNNEESLLLFEKASELGYAYSRDDIRGQLTALRESKGLSEEEFEKVVEEQTQLTLPELIDLRQREDSAQVVFQSQVINKIQIEDNEVARYYEGHLDEFMEPATYRISEIVFLKDEEQPGAARAKVEECVRQLEQGMDFTTAAQQYSDSISKEQGGDLGQVKFGDLLPVIEEQVRALEIGAYSEILETPAAYFLIKLKERNPERPKPIDAVREEIVNALRQPRVQIEMDKYLEKLRQEYSIKTYTPEIPWYLEF